MARLKSEQSVDFKFSKGETGCTPLHPTGIVKLKGNRLCLLLKGFELGNELILADLTEIITSVTSAELVQ